MFSFRPAMQSLRKVVGASPLDLEDTAIDRWLISEASKSFIRPATFLTHHLDRIRATEFGALPDVVRALRGGYDLMHQETLGFRLKNIDLVDGVLYAERAIKDLRPRSRRLPAYAAPNEVTNGALYESWVGNRWFGNWLSDDCLTYSLAERFGVPVTTRVMTQGHEREYASRLGLTPGHVSFVHFEDLILFRDTSHNEGRRLRAKQFRKRLLSSAPPVMEHAGVFLLRGSSGDRRILMNEMEIADRVATRRGFRVLDPSSASIEDIIAACAGARVVAGVEGSHLVHGLVMMPPGAALLVIQPPDRVVSALKMITDRQDQIFAFVVGEGKQEGFIVEWDDVDRTLDMVAA